MCALCAFALYVRFLGISDVIISWDIPIIDPSIEKRSKFLSIRYFFSEVLLFKLIFKLCSDQISWSKIIYVKYDFLDILLSL